MAEEESSKKKMIISVHLIWFITVGQPQVRKNKPGGVWTLSEGQPR